MALWGFNCNLTGAIKISEIVCNSFVGNNGNDEENRDISRTYGIHLQLYIPGQNSH